jgi:hypothetical protein
MPQGVTQTTRQQHHQQRPAPQDGSIVPETYATKQQLEALGAKLGVDVKAAVDAGGKAARKRKKQKAG